MDALFVVQKVFREVFDDDLLEIGAETTPADIPGWDSIAQIKIVLTVEEQLGVRLDNDDVAAIKGVGDLLSAIARQRP